MSRSNASTQRFKHGGGPAKAARPAAIGPARWRAVLQSMGDTLSQICAAGLIRDDNEAREILFGMATDIDPESFDAEVDRLRARALAVATSARREKSQIAQPVRDFLAADRGGRTFLKL